MGYVENDDGSLTLAFAASGDTNLDGLFDSLDLANIVTSGLLDSGLPAAWWQGDFNYDGFVDILDVSAMFSTGLYDQLTYLPSSRSARAAAFAIYDAETSAR